MVWSVTSAVSTSVTLWAVACQSPLSMGFSRQQYWSGLLCPSLGDLTDLGIEPVSACISCIAGGFFTHWATWEATWEVMVFSGLLFSLELSSSCLSEKAMAPHSSTFAWKIPRTEEPGRLQSMGSRRVSHYSERLHFHFSLLCIGEGNGKPLKCSCLENPRDGVAQSWTRLKSLSSSSSSSSSSCLYCWFCLLLGFTFLSPSCFLHSN